MNDNNWRHEAACIDTDTDTDSFFPEGTSNDVAAALRVCKRCPMRAVIGCAREACAIEAADITLSGVWAGIRVAQSASSRIGAIRELHAIAGIPYSAPSRRGEWPRPCNRCHRAMRQRNVNLADQPDTVRHRAAGLCDSCHRVTVGETTRSRIRPAAVAS